jgi:hypothetical protein
LSVFPFSRQFEFDPYVPSETSGTESFGGADVARRFDKQVDKPVYRLWFIARRFALDQRAQKPHNVVLMVGSIPEEPVHRLL